MLSGEEHSTSGETKHIHMDYLKKKKRSKEKKRFSDNQIRSMESIFVSESKLEPRKKLQLAEEIGLEPRQVAIWFQNKRARWKSKQLEREYNILRANYNALASQFEVLNKEKQSLAAQLQRLRGLMEDRTDAKLKAIENINGESEVRLGLSLEGSEHGVGVLSDEDSSIKAEYMALDEETDQLLNMVEPVDDSPDNWGSLDSNGLLDESSSSYQWWNFWS
ncbi:hypothetical protein LguiA_010517 [Lonicera macranthoides]